MAGLSLETKQWRITNHICIKCGQESALPSSQKGERCTAAIKTSNDKTKARRIANGWCIDCPDKDAVLATNGRRCQRHAEYQERCRTNRRNKRKLAGVCTECSKAVMANGNALCNECIEKRSVLRLQDYNKRVREGRCGYGGCDNLPEIPHVYCVQHREANAEQKAMKYSDCKTAGICFFCLPKITKLADGEVTCKDCKEVLCKVQVRIYTRLRHKIFDHYGWECKCCSLGIPEMLEVDHINGGGTGEIRKLGGNNALYRSIVARNFPPEYQILCAGCNRAKRDSIACLHVQLSPTAMRRLREVNTILTNEWKALHPESFQLPVKRKNGRKKKYNHSIVA